MVDDRTDRYCVIGAGSSGLAAAKNLREHGFAVDCFEREDDVGGNWNFGKPNSRVYASTHLISSKPFTQYPDFPMPDAFPDYPHHSHMLEYFQRYARHFGLYDVIRFGTSVERVEPFGGTKAWDVTTSAKGEERRVGRYAGVVIANGHNWFPKLPEYPGNFTGDVMHSAAYKGPQPLRGKRVLVVGAGNTGCDVAVEAAQNAAAAFHSTRRGYWYAQKYVFGKPSDQVYDLVLGLRLPKRVVQFLLESTVRLTTGDISRVGLKRPDHRMLETHPIVNQQLVYYVGHGEITPVDDIACYEGDTVVFTDGRREVIDLIVFCTGYLVQFPFLEPHHLNWHDGRPHLYKNVFTPQHDNLFVCGLIQPDSGQFTLVHWQSVAIATFLQARDQRPAAAAKFSQMMQCGLDEHLGGGVRYKESTRHHYEINHFDYLRGLERAIHVLEGVR